MKRESRFKLLLLWVAASDGKLEESELEFVESKLPDTGEALILDDFLEPIAKQDFALLEESVQMAAVESRARRTAFLETAITLSLADNEFADVENHILRFYADALHLGKEILDERFQKIAGHALPEPAGSEKAAQDELTHATLKTIGALRNRLVPGGDGSWFNRTYPDYVVKRVVIAPAQEPVIADGSSSRRKRRRKSKKSSNTNYIVFIFIVLVIIVMAYVFSEF
jgi:uncharacterized tellurite resistance protein B-like protein